MKRKHLITVLAVAAGALVGCDSKPAAVTPASAKPVATAPVTGDPAAGKQLFAAKTCSACHQMDAKVVGPPLRGVVAKRGEDWVLRMIQSPDQMVKEDPAAKALFEEYKTPMPNLQLTEAEAASIVAYLKSQG